MREGHERADRLVDFIAYTVGSVEVVGSYVFPDLVEVCVGLRVEDKSVHELALRSSVLALAAKLGKGFFTINRLHAAVLEVVVPAIQRVPNLSQFLQIPGHCVLDQVAGRTPTLAGELLKARLGLGSKAYFHTFQFRTRIEKNKLSFPQPSFSQCSPNLDRSSAPSNTRLVPQQKCFPAPITRCESGFCP